MQGDNHEEDTLYGAPGYRGALADAFGVPSEDKERAQGRQIPSVVAKVNGKEITADQYRNQWHVLHRMHMRAGGLHMIGPEYEESMKHEVLERLIILELLRQKAGKMNIQPDPEDVEQRLQEIRGSAGLAGAMGHSALGGQEPNTDTYRADIASSMKIRKLPKQEVYDKVMVGPKDITVRLPPD